MIQSLLFGVSFCFTQHGGFLMRLQFSSCMLNDGVKFLIIRSNVTKSSQSACSVHLGFSLYAIAVLLLVEKF